MAKLPYMQFYPADYQADTRCLSLASRGAWMDLICILWRAEKRGKKTLSLEAWARELGAPSSEVSLIFTDLKHHKIANIEMDDHQAVTIVARRLLREEKRRVGDRLRQQEQRDKGGGDVMRWFSIRARILHLDNFLCGYCGKKARTVDHIIPRCDGGSDEDRNLVACCKSCNNIKNKRSLAECGFTILYSSRHTVITQPSQHPSQRIHREISEVRSQKSESEEELRKKETTLSSSPKPELDDGAPCVPTSTRNYRAEAREVLEFLNAKTGKHFRPVETTIAAIAARLKGQSAETAVDVQTCKSLIAKKARDWLPDDKMRVFLRPETLFNRTKFESYLGEVSACDARNATDSCTKMPRGVPADGVPLRS